MYANDNACWDCGRVGCHGDGCWPSDDPYTTVGILAEREKEREEDLEPMVFTDEPVGPLFWLTADGVQHAEGPPYEEED